MQRGHIFNIQKNDFSKEVCTNLRQISHVGCGAPPGSSLLPHHPKPKASAKSMKQKKKTKCGIPAKKMQQNP